MMFNSYYWKKTSFEWTWHQRGTDTLYNSNVVIDPANNRYWNDLEWIEIDSTIACISFWLTLVLKTLEPVLDEKDGNCDMSNVCI